MKKIYVLLAFIFVIAKCNTSSASITCYKDADADLYSNGEIEPTDDTCPTDYYIESELTATSGDCDDTDPNVYPGATEIIDGKDNDCDSIIDNVSGGEGDDDCPGGSTPDVCDGVDNDCDPSTPDGSGEDAPNNTMQSGVCSGSVQICVGGIWTDDYSGVADYEVTEVSCDGKDNNCNGETDEGFGTITCGVGECEKTVNECEDGVLQTCTPGEISAERCDGKDNDCDGEVDEELGEIECGRGECYRKVNKCENGVPQTCTPGEPSEEVCDGKDNDCNGDVDDGPFYSVTCGKGECMRTMDTCHNGIPGQCVPGEPEEEECNGRDDNCDGQIDEGFASYWEDPDCRLHGTECRGGRIISW